MSEPALPMPGVAASAAPPSSLAAEYFDGRSARAHDVTLHWVGTTLHVVGTGVALQLEGTRVAWSERTRHGARVAHLPSGALHCRDAAACDAWLRAAGRGESWVVRLQQSWRWVGVSVLVLAVALVAIGVWGIRGLSHVAVQAIPGSVDQQLGQATLATLDRHVLQPSALDSSRQQRVRQAFARAVALQPRGSVPEHELLFRAARGRASLGPNAFALPGGTVVLTDALVDLLDAEPDVLVGVLAHELGHVRQRHGMRMVVQASLVGVLSSLVLGDFSSILAAAPVVLGQASYSRDAEREADAHGAAFLKGAGISPAVMITLFEKLAAARSPPGEPGSEARSKPAAPPEPAGWLGIAIASHPADSERIEFFRAAAR